MIRYLICYSDRGIKKVCGYCERYLNENTLFPYWYAGERLTFDGLHQKFSVPIFLIKCDKIDGHCLLDN